MPSSRIRVESTSITTRRLARRNSPAGSTAMSSPVSVGGVDQARAQPAPPSARRRSTRCCSAARRTAARSTRCRRPDRRSRAACAPIAPGPQRVPDHDDVVSAAPSPARRGARRGLPGPARTTSHSMPRLRRHAMTDVAKRPELTAQIEQDGQDQPIADHHLLDVANLDVMGGQRGEERRGDTRSIAAGDGREHSGRFHALAPRATPRISPATSPAAGQCGRRPVPRSSTVVARRWRRHAPPSGRSTARPACCLGAQLSSVAGSDIRRPAARSGCAGSR